MPKSLLKGETSQVQVRFPSNFTVAGTPAWVLYDWNGSELLDGAATVDNDGLWNAIVTIPKTIVLPGGEQDFAINFNAVSTSGKSLTVSKTVNVVDVSDSWRDYGLLYSTGRPSVCDTVFLNHQPIKITAFVREGYDNSIGAAPAYPTVVDINTNVPGSNAADPPPLRGSKIYLDSDLVYTSLTRDGFAYKIEVPINTANPIVDQSAGFYPFQLVVYAEFDTNTGLDPEEIIKPVHVVTPSIVTRLNSVKRFLDKARLIEIDQTLQWHNEELIHFLIEGMHYINGYGEPTYWKLSKMPPQMYDPCSNAAAWKALNARFLAEGLNAFEMQGANVSLSFNRRDVIQTKMDELKGVLDQQLQYGKPAAIRTHGKGQPPPGAMTELGSNGLGVLGMEYGPTTNPSRYINNYRPGMSWRY